VKGIFLLKITGSGCRESQWIVDLKNGKGSVKYTGGKFVLCFFKNSYHISLSKSWAFISFPISKTRCLNKGSFYLRPDVYFQHFNFAPGIYLSLCMLIDCNGEHGHS